MSFLTSLIPLIPMLISGGLGAASKLTEKKPKFDKLPTMTSGQQGLQDMIISLLSGQGGQQGGPLGFLQDLLNPSAESASKFEAPFKRQFQEEIVPGLAERFSGAGAGAQRSSAFQQALGSAGAGLSENLANVRGGMQMQGLQGLLSLLSPAFKDSFAYQEKPGGGRLSGILGSFGAGTAKGLGGITPGLTQKYWGF